MNSVMERDYFTDRSVLLDPYDYLDQLRANGPVCRLGARDIIAVTGFKECAEVLLNTADFSSVINVAGPVFELPFAIEGDDISDQIETHRDEIPNANLLVAYDGEKHAAARSLLNPLFTPSRLKANEAFMNRLADEMAREASSRGGCELMREIATPFVTLVIADLLGVPEQDRDEFRKVLDAAPAPNNMDTADHPPVSPVLQFMGGYFAKYIADRRANPRQDVMTELAQAKYPDGSTPELMELVRAAMFLFAAGQDTSAKLIGNAVRFLCDDPALQQRLRADRSLIAPFVEETLRLEGSTKVTFRLAKRKTRIGDMEIPVGTKVMVALAAANRDPNRWENPAEFRLDRTRNREHLTFGRGAHTCAGAPLARVEVRVMLDHLLGHTSEISLSEAHHGTVGDRRLDYEASFVIRGLKDLHVNLLREA